MAQRFNDGNGTVLTARATDGRRKVVPSFTLEFGKHEVINKTTGKTFATHSLPKSRQAVIDAGGLDYVAFYDKSFLKFERILETYIASVPKGLPSFLRAMPMWIKRKLFIPDLIRKSLAGFDGQMLFPEHHESHAASAFYPSPFERAAVVTLDGVGEWATATLGVGEGARLRLLKEIDFPHSLGLLYSSFTYFTGFKVNSGLGQFDRVEALFLEMPTDSGTDDAAQHNWYDHLI